MTAIASFFNLVSIIETNTSLIRYYMLRLIASCDAIFLVYFTVLDQSEDVKVTVTSKQRSIHAIMQKKCIVRGEYKVT